MQRMGGNRRKTRHKLAKNVREHGKIQLTKYLQEFSVGDRVCLTAEPAVQKGMYFPRFHGKTGVVSGQQGNCYSVTITDGKKVKSLLVHPVHLRKV